MPDIKHKRTHADGDMTVNVGKPFSLDNGWFWKAVATIAAVVIIPFMFAFVDMYYTVEALGKTAEVQGATIKTQNESIGALEVEIAKLNAHLKYAIMDTPTNRNP